jgi:Putative lumazine-binding
MKKAFLVSTLLFLLQCTGNSQSAQDIIKIGEVVRAFSALGDKQDAAGLDKILHPQYRAVVHRALGSADLSLMDKILYLQLMRDKKIGGDTREVHLLQVDVVNNIASVRAVFQGKAFRFTTYISLVKLENGEWQIVGDMPDIAKA